MSERRQGRTRGNTATLDTRPDLDLTAQASAGNPTAFEALYRRHAGVAWRVASSVASNPSDAADAVSDAFSRVLSALAAGRLEDGTLFRSYLIAATRNAAIDLHRRGRRVQPSDSVAEEATAPTVPSPAEAMEGGEEAAFVAEAFRGLPERWRSVLWLTEVEQVPTQDVAGLLGMTPNGLAQLAFRARAALRERFVQAHLRHPIGQECRACVDRLGGYVLGTLSPRAVAKVDQHLSECAACRTRADELQDLGTSLRRIALPLPFLLGSMSLAKWKLAATAASAAPSAAPVAGGGISWSNQVLAKVQRPLLAASTGIFALGVISASVLGGPVDPAGGRNRRAPFAAPSPNTSQVVEERLVLTSGEGLADGGAAPLDPALLAGFEFTTDDATAEATADDDAAAAAGASAGPDAAAAPAPAPSDPAPPPPATDVEPVVNAGTTVAIAGEALGLTAGYGPESCTGLATIVVAGGCAPPPAPDSGTGVVIATDGSVAGGLLDDQTVSIGL